MNMNTIGDKESSNMKKLPLINDQQRDTFVKNRSANKKDFPINIFLLSSKQLENRPAEKYEVFLGKYVRSYLVKDIHDPNNKILPMTRSESPIKGNIYNHLINKTNMRMINNLSRNIGSVKLEGKNSLSPLTFKETHASIKSPKLSIDSNLIKTKTFDKELAMADTILRKSNKAVLRKKTRSVFSYFTKNDFYYS